MTDETPTNGSGGTSAGSAPPQKPVTTVTAGTLIMGTYEIEKLINSGGMGEVYRGRNIHNGEPVAIKIVLPSLAHDQKIVALFQKESTVLSRLAHEAIVRYHVFTNDPTIGRPCMVMEFVSGTPLADRIEQGPMPVEDVRTMLRRVASGLDKAHRAGVVHRDLSPDNVILEEGQVEHAKLIDFGIAKSTNFGSGTLLQGQFAGKFNWVSPEQLGAYGGQVDGRSDIYSLALIIAGASRGQVLQMGASIVDAVSKRASVPDLTGVDPQLVPLLTWMLEPDPAKRVESMAKVIAALDNPELIPGPPAPPPPDPNRTVIEPLPQLTIPPVAAATSAPPAGTAPPPAPATAPPVASPTGGDWDMPAPRQVSHVAPDGATIIAPQSLVSAPPVAPAPPDEDISPFGAPASPAKPAVAPAPAAAPAPQKGKGGMIGALAVLAIAAGGAGAWFGGVFDGGDPAPKPDQPEVVAKTDPAEPVKAPEPTGDASAEAKAAEEARKAQEEAAAKAAADAEAAKVAQEDPAATAAAAQKAAEEAAAKAAADAEAAKQAEAEAAAKAQADAEASRKAAEEAAAKAAEQAQVAAMAAADEARSHMESISAANSMAEVARTEAAEAAQSAAKADPAQGVAPVQALAEVAANAARKAQAAADAAAQGLASARTAAAAAASVEAAAKGLDDLLVKAGAEAAAAAESAAKADAEAKATAATATKLAEAEAARLAEEQQKQAAIKADPVARQQAFLADFVPPSCVHVGLAEPRAEGFALHGYAVQTKPLEELSAAWAAATETRPDVAVHLVNEEQCPALDFMNNHRGGDAVTLRLTAGEVVKSGTPVEGVIEGAAGRPLTLFLVNGKGGATNLKDFVTTGTDGSVSFKFRVKLAEGLPPEPQVLVVLASDEATNALLDKVKPGTSTGGLFPFVDNRMKEAGVAPAVGLGFFRLEN